MVFHLTLTFIIGIIRAETAALERHCGSSQVRDAVAVIQLLMWLEKVVSDGTETELSAAEYVNKCRR